MPSESSASTASSSFSSSAPSSYFRIAVSALLIVFVVLLAARATGNGVSPLSGTVDDKKTLTDPLRVTLSPPSDVSGKVSAPKTASSPASLPESPFSENRNNNNNNNNRSRSSDDARQILASTRVGLTGKCLTYEQRYAQCRSIYSRLVVAAATEEQQHEDWVASETAGGKKMRSSDKLVSFFGQVYHMMMSPSTTKATATTNLAREVVLLRMHKKAWPEDFWLSVCAMIIEASGVNDDLDAQHSTTSAMTESGSARRRHVFLYTLDGHETSVPAEFQPFIRVHPETELQRLFFHLPYDIRNRTGHTEVNGGYLHGDIACGIFMKQNPIYRFAWMMEADVRFAGDWSNFFSRSRQVARSSKNYVPTAPQNGGGDRGKDAHLIWWYPRMLNYGYGFLRLDAKDDPRVNEPQWQKNLVAQWVRESAQVGVPEKPAADIHNVHGWCRQSSFRNKWYHTFSETMWASAFVPAMGLSRRLALLTYNTYLEGNGNLNQEATLPLVAQLHALKIVSLAGLKPFPSQFYFAFRKKDVESAPLYLEWLRGEAVTKKAASFYGLWTEQFEGKKCLEGVLHHPIKL